MFVCVFPFYLFKQICIICWIKYIQYVAHSLAQRHIHSYFIDKPILFAIKCNVLFYEFCMLYVVCIKMYIIVGFEVDKCGFSKIKLLHAWCSCVYLRAFLASNKFQTSFFVIFFVFGCIIRETIFELNTNFGLLSKCTFTHMMMKNVF